MNFIEIGKLYKTVNSRAFHTSYVTNHINYLNSEIYPIKLNEIVLCVDFNFCSKVKKKKKIEIVKLTFFHNNNICYCCFEQNSWAHMKFTSETLFAEVV